MNEQAYDIEVDTAFGGWVALFKYSANEQLLSGEIGPAFGVRFLVSSRSLQARYVPAGGHNSDPLGQQILVGCEIAMGAGLLDKNGPRYLRVESATTTI